MKFVIEKQYLLEEKFFKGAVKILDDTFNYDKTKDISVVIIAHALVDAIPFLKILSSRFSVSVIFAKPKSINQRIFDHLSGQYNIIIADRAKINDIEYLSKFVDKKNDGFILIDIGGYFAKVSKTLREVFSTRFLGSVEDTENGLRKYLSNKINYPFYQVARSSLKANEDYLVGQAISYSAESVFRDSSILLNGQKIGVIGYGKIGSGVAHALKARQSIVFVNDIDPVKVTHAYSHGFIPQEKDVLLNNSDIICLASGSKCLYGTDFENIKKGAYLFTVTSSDDEIDLSWLKKNYQEKEISELITQYTKDSHYFYILNKGNAINFLHGTTVGSFILLVQAEIIACMYALACKKAPEDFYSIQDKVRKDIAQKWLDIFTSQYNQINSKNE